jgi:CubicO group peptidase (beta-lactamase class C family)
MVKFVSKPINMKYAIYQELISSFLEHKDERFVLKIQVGDETVDYCSGLDEENKPISDCSVFRLASVSKQFISYGLHLLVEKKLISYQTKITSVINELDSCYDDVTIEHVLTHTSGLPDYEEITDESKPQFQDKDILSFLNWRKHLYFTPGSRYSYSNSGYVLLGQIIERISKMNLSTYLEKEVFSPLNLQSTTTNQRLIATIPHVVLGHVFENNTWVKKDQAWSTATLGDGGIYSCSKDLFLWLDFLRDLNQTNAYPQMFQDGKDIPCAHYGFGLRNITLKNKATDKVYYHCGDTLGTSTAIGFCPNRKIKFVLLVSSGGYDAHLFVETLVKMLNEGKNLFNLI